MRVDQLQWIGAYSALRTKTRVPCLSRSMISGYHFRRSLRFEQCGSIVVCITIIIAIRVLNVGPNGRSVRGRTRPSFFEAPKMRRSTVHHYIPSAVHPHHDSGGCAQQGVKKILSTYVYWQYSALPRPTAPHQQTPHKTSKGHINQYRQLVFFTCHVFCICLL